VALQLIDESDTLTVKDSDLPDVPDGDPDVVYTLRPISTETHRELAKKHTSHPINPRTHQKEDRLDGVALADDLFDYALVGWSGILWKGQPAELTRANKMKIDALRKSSMLGLAGLNQIARQPEVKAESFPAVDPLVPVLGR